VVAVEAAALFHQLVLVAQVEQAVAVLVLQAQLRQLTELPTQEVEVEAVVELRGLETQTVALAAPAS
jgi:hypothetical protein